MINYNPITPSNFAPLLKTTTENGTHRIVARGGRYSGKTTTVIQDALDGYISIPGANIVIARVDDCDFRKTSFATVKKELYRFGIAQYCDIPKRTGDIIFRPNGNIIRFIATGGDEHRTKGLDFERGYVHRFIHDEAQELTEEFEVKGAEKTLLRLMGDTTKWIYIYNPPPFRGEFANQYFPKLVREGRAIEIYSSWEDIYDLLEPEVIAEIERDKASDYNYYLYEYMGQITAANGLVYPQFRREKHVTNIYQLLAQGDRVIELILGLDEGTVNDSTCVTPLAIMGSGRAVVLDCFENAPLLHERFELLIRALNPIAAAHALAREYIAYGVPHARRKEILTVQHGHEARRPLQPLLYIRPVIRYIRLGYHVHERTVVDYVLHVLPACFKHWTEYRTAGRSRQCRPILIICHNPSL